MLLGNNTDTEVRGAIVSFRIAQIFRKVFWYLYIEIVCILIVVKFVLLSRRYASFDLEI